MYPLETKVLESDAVPTKLSRIPKCVGSQNCNTTGKRGLFVKETQFPCLLYGWIQVVENKLLTVYIHKLYLGLQPILRHLLKLIKYSGDDLLIIIEEDVFWGFFLKSRKNLGGAFLKRELHSTMCDIYLEKRDSQRHSTYRAHIAIDEIHNKFMTSLDGEKTICRLCLKALSKKKVIHVIEQNKSFSSKILLRLLWSNKTTMIRV